MFAFAFKWVSVAAMLATSMALAFDAAPPYRSLTEYDVLVWSAAFAMGGLAQIAMLMLRDRRCYSCRVWGDFLLQLEGFSFIILAAEFTAAYPPFNWAMVAYPIAGFSCLFFGRVFSKRSRKKHIGATHGASFDTSY